MILCTSTVHFASVQRPARQLTGASTLFMCADAKAHWPIHREAPAFIEQSTEQEILTTGIKVKALLGLGG